MKTYATTEIIQMLQAKQVSLFSLVSFGALFHIANRHTLYKKIARLEQKKIIQRLTKGKYRFLLLPGNDFLTANFLYQPSYISLESALSFYSIITGFPYRITSLSVKPTKTIHIDHQQFTYSQIGNRLFWGYVKKEDFLIADPEKALLDYIYLGIKGLRNPDVDEMDLTSINRKKIVLYAKTFHNDRITAIINKHIL